MTHGYEIDWENLEQVNIKTGVCRQIIRKKVETRLKSKSRRKSFVQSIADLSLGDNEDDEVHLN